MVSRLCNIVTELDTGQQHARGFRITTGKPFDHSHSQHVWNTTQALQLADPPGSHVGTAQAPDSVPAVLLQSNIVFPKEVNLAIELLIHVCTNPSTLSDQIARFIIDN